MLVTEKRQTKVITFFSVVNVFNVAKSSSSNLLLNCVGGIDDEKAEDDDQWFFFRGVGKNRGLGR